MSAPSFYVDFDAGSTFAPVVRGPLQPLLAGSVTSGSSEQDFVTALGEGV
jgi:hypothetical protein